MKDFNFHFNFNLYVILAFVVVLFGIRRYFQWKRYQAWHETARIALEKGQPVPLAEPSEHGRWGNRAHLMSDLRRGLMLVALGAGLYLALPAPGKMYAAIPTFIGAVNLLLALLALTKTDKAPDSPNRQPSDRA